MANDFILILCVMSCIISQVPKYSEPLPVFSFSKVCITVCGGWFVSLCVEGGLYPCVWRVVCIPVWGGWFVSLCVEGGCIPVCGGWFVSLCVEDGLYPCVRRVVILNLYCGYANMFTTFV